MDKPIRQLNLGASPKTDLGANPKPKGRSGVDLVEFVAQYYVLLAFGLVVAILAIGYFLLIKPSYEEAITTGKYNLDTLKVEKSRRDDHLKELEELVVSLRSINRQDIDKLHQVLPDKKGVADLLVQLQALTAENGFSLKSVTVGEQGQPEERRGAAPVQRVSISLTLAGPGYEQFKRLLTAIEYNLRLFDVNAVYFSPGSPEYSINLFTYYLPSR